jgi:HlyD family secretion protein
MASKQKKKKRRIYYIVGGAVVLLIVIAMFKGGGKNDEAIEVKVATVERHTITETVDASGKIQPELEVKISADVSGELIELLVLEGQKVEQGQLLARINPDLSESALNRADASANSARANLANSKARLAQVKATFISSKSSYERSKNLYGQDAISLSEWETAEAQYAGALADVEAAEQTVNANHYSVLSAQATRKEAADNLGRTSIFAPTSGTVSRLLKEKGERVVGTAQMEGTVIMHIANLRTMEADVEVNENDIVRIDVGDTAYIEVDAYLGRKFKGLVTEIANSANNSGSSMDQVTNFSVKVRLLRTSYDDLIDQERPHLSPFRPGMSANVEIRTETETNILSVPIEAVTTRDDTTARKKSGSWEDALTETDEDAEEMECVFVMVNGEARLVLVETGIQDTKFIHVKSGLTGTEEVITGPFQAVSQKLYNRDKVELMRDFERGSDK